MRTNRLKCQYYIKKHWRELISFVVALVAAFVTFVFSNQPGTVFGVSILLTIVSAIVTLYLLFQEKDFYYLSMDHYGEKDDWFGAGKFEFNKKNNAYLIADTDAGFIFSKCLLWKDYSFTGDFKILNKHLGVILRATNLSNYVMLQITKNTIRPHLRVNGGWIIFETDVTGLIFEKKKEIEDGSWYKFELVVMGELVEIKIFKGKSILLNKSWNITSGKVSVPIYNKEDNDRKVPTHILDIIVSYDYGAIGFRNGHSERALVRNLLVKSINNK